MEQKIYHLKQHVTSLKEKDKLNDDTLPLDLQKDIQF